MSCRSFARSALSCEVSVVLPLDRLCAWLATVLSSEPMVIIWRSPVDRNHDVSCCSWLTPGLAGALARGGLDGAGLAGAVAGGLGAAVVLPDNAASAARLA